MRRWLGVMVLAVGAAALAGGPAHGDNGVAEDPGVLDDGRGQVHGNTIVSHDKFGTMKTVSPGGPVDFNNAFFRPLGTTGTTCEHCHFATDAWGISAAHARKLFDDTKGTHPVFRPHSSNDPVRATQILNDPNATVQDRRSVYSLMIDKADALARIQLCLPADPSTCPKGPGGTPTAADYYLADVIDPSLPASVQHNPAAYLAYTSSAPGSNAGNSPQMWVHRRPLATTNFRFLTAALWDGRAQGLVANPAGSNAGNPVTSTTRAAVVRVGADTIKARLLSPGEPAPANIDALAEEMTEFQFSILTAQSELHGAGKLSSDGALGGPENLAGVNFYFGINDVLGAFGEVFDIRVFTLYDAWLSQDGKHKARREAVARGQELFNSARLTVQGVGGLNNATNVVLFDPNGNSQTIAGPVPATILTGCGSCHDTPNAGDHSNRLPINIGVADPVPAGLGSQAVADLPQFKLCKLDDSACTWTTDPGRAIRSGRYGHIGQFKGPILHGLAARAPYFHNGMARDLDDVVDFYDTRFNAHFSEKEKKDLITFLSSL